MKYLYSAYTRKEHMLLKQDWDMDSNIQGTEEYKQQYWRWIQI